MEIFLTLTEAHADSSKKRSGKKKREYREKMSFKILEK